MLVLKKKMLHEAVKGSVLQGELGTDGMDGMDWTEEGSEKGEKKFVNIQERGEIAMTSGSHAVASRSVEGDQRADST
jgi:hypothetical protein